MSAETIPSAKELAECYLRPQRPRLAEARACVAATYTPKEAWEKLYTEGLIPESWLADPLRRFRISPSKGPRGRILRTHSPEELLRLPADSSERGVVPTAPIPTRKRDAAIIASNVPAIEAVEELARECVRRWIFWAESPPALAPNARLDPWKQNRIERSPQRNLVLDDPLPVVWKIRSPSPTAFPELCMGVATAVDLIFDVGGGTQYLSWTNYHSQCNPRRAARARRGAPASSVLSDELQKELGFEDTARGRSLFRMAHACRDAAVRWEQFRTTSPNQTLRDIRLRRRLPPTLTMRKLAEIPNPFTPLLSLFLLGYSIVDWNRRCVWLECPPDEVEFSRP